MQTFGGSATMNEQSFGLSEGDATMNFSYFRNNSIIYV